MATFLHGLTMFAVFCVFSQSVAWFTGWGGFGAKSAHARAADELQSTGRVSINASLPGRLFGASPITLDAQGFSFKEGSAWRRYPWSEIQKPLSVERTGRTSHSIVFHVLVQNPNFGRRRLFANTKDKILLIRRELPDSYTTGNNQLIAMMNQLRECALAGGQRQA